MKSGLFKKTIETVRKHALEDIRQRLEGLEGKRHEFEGLLEVTGDSLVAVKVGRVKSDSGEEVGEEGVIAEVPHTGVVNGESLLGESFPAEDAARVLEKLEEDGVG